MKVKDVNTELSSGIIAISGNKSSEKMEKHQNG